MTTQSSISSRQRPRALFSNILKPMSQAENCSGGCTGCRASQMTRLNREGMQACQAGALGEADRLLHQAIDMARQSGVSMYEAKMRNNLGLVLLLDSRLEDAQREFGLALGLVENKLGRENKLYKTIEGNFRRAQAA